MRQWLFYGVPNQNYLNKLKLLGLKSPSSKIGHHITLGYFYDSCLFEPEEINEDLTNFFSDKSNFFSKNNKSNNNKINKYLNDKNSRDIILKPKEIENWDNRKVLTFKSPKIKKLHFNLIVRNYLLGLFIMDNPYFGRGYINPETREIIGNGYNPHISLCKKNEFENKDLSQLLEEEVLIDKIGWCRKEDNIFNWENFKYVDL